MKAPRLKIYQALIDAKSIAQWKFPAGMSCHIHSFDGREGGTFRISLTYDEPSGVGKTNAHTDTYHGRFVRLVPGELVVEEDEFESTDPSMQGIMTITIRLSEFENGTKVTGKHEGLPKGVSISDNEKGWQLAFTKLAALVETR